MKIRILSVCIRRCHLSNVDKRVKRQNGRFHVVVQETNVVIFIIANWPYETFVVVERHTVI